jgi:hypothetical protein
MSQTLENGSQWRARAVVSVAEAAAILGRSTSWVRDRLTDNTLEIVDFPETKRIAITVRSVVRLSERTKNSQTCKRPAERPWLRLVVDNDPK